MSATEPILVFRQDHVAHTDDDITFFKDEKMNRRTLVKTGMITLVITAAMLPGCAQNRWQAGSCNCDPGPGPGYESAPYYGGAATDSGIAAPPSAPGFGGSGDFGGGGVGSGSR